MYLVKHVAKVTFHLKGCSLDNIDLLLGIINPVLISWRLVLILGFLVFLKKLLDDNFITFIFLFNFRESCTCYSVTTMKRFSFEKQTFRNL
jgi:hypothetical protein